MKLRDYQLEAIDLIEGHMVFDTAPCCLAAPTSFGKTITIGHLIKDLVADGKDVVFMMNLTSLVSQTCLMLDSLDIKYNVLSASYTGKQSGPSAKVKVVMQQTLSSRLDEMSKHGTLPKCDVLIIDEMHISHDTRTMNKVKEALRPSNIIGLSATPIDEKGAVLKNVTIIETETTKDLTRDGYLTHADTYILNYAQELDFSDIGSGEDYTDPEIDAKLNNPEYNQAVVDGWESYRQELTLKTIVFVSTIEHAVSLRDTFREAGFKAQAYHSKMTATQRKDEMNLFRDNLTEVMISVSSLIAGFDMPDIECGIMCRPTKRARTYLQAVGRILRLHKDKEGAIWIDAAKVTSDHGLYNNPYDFTISDHLELKKYKQKRAEPYLSAFVKKNKNSKHLTSVTEKHLKSFKSAIEKDSSPEALNERFKACMEVKELMNLLEKIAKVASKHGFSKEFVSETVVPYVNEGGSIKAIKTRAGNILNQGKKLNSLHYFPKWLKEQNWN